MGETEVPTFLQLGAYFVKDCVVGVAMHRGYALSSRIAQLISRVAACSNCGAIILHGPQLGFSANLLAGTRLMDWQCGQTI